MESRRVTFNCNKCVYSTKRSYNLKRHILNEHGVAKNTVVPIKTSDGPSHLGDGLPKRPRIQEPDDGLYTEKEYKETMDTLDGSSPLGDGLPRHQPKSEPEDGLYTKEEYEQTMSTIRARFPTMNFDIIDPRFMHPFTAIIAGPSQSGKSVFCMRLIRNARECIAPVCSPCPEISWIGGSCTLGCHACYAGVKDVVCFPSLVGKHNSSS